MLAGLPCLTAHGLRHTSATLMLASAVPPKVAAERLGHADATLFTNLYSHANDPARGGKSTWCRAVRRRGWERARRPAAAEALGPLMWLPSQIAAWSRPAARRSPVGGPWWHPDIERRPPGVAALPLEPNTACHAVVRPGGDGEVVVVDDSLNEH